MNDEHDETFERKSTGDEFWGTTPDWSASTTRPKRVAPGHRTDLKGAIKGWWGSALTSGVEATREHRIVDADAVHLDDRLAGREGAGRGVETRPLIDASMFDDLDDEISMIPTGRQRIVEPSVSDDEMRRELGQLSAGTAPAKRQRTSIGRIDQHLGHVGHVAFDQDHVDQDHVGHVAFDQDHVSQDHVSDDAFDSDRVDAGSFDSGVDEAFAFAPASMAEQLDDRRAARPGIDPLLVRLGAVVVVLSLAIPLAMGLTSDSSDADTLASNDAAVLSAASPAIAPVAAPTSSPAQETAQLDPSLLPDAVPVADEQASTVTSDDTADANSERADDVFTDAETTTETNPSDDADATSSETTIDAVTDVSKPATVDSNAERVTSCAIEYTVLAGDFWIRLAEGAGVSLSELLDANGATVDSQLFPGMTICLPAGSTTPPKPPVTTDPPNTDPPTTAPPNTDPPNTDPPTTVATTPVGPDAVKQIIRDVWPDDLEDRAIEIANRESRFDPRAQNYCCYGVFQIYFSVHQSWLDDLGVTSAEQLFDPAVNVRAAYTLYQRSGGWGPWGF